MPKFKIVCYPSQRKFTVEVEAATMEDAIEEAEEVANRECYFCASDLSENRQLD